MIHIGKCVGRINRRSDTHHQCWYSIHVRSGHLVGAHERRSSCDIRYSLQKTEKWGCRVTGGGGSLFIRQICYSAKIVLRLLSDAATLVLLSALSSRCERFLCIAPLLKYCIFGWVLKTVVRSMMTTSVAFKRCRGLDMSVHFRETFHIVLS